MKRGVTVAQEGRGQEKIALGRENHQRTNAYTWKPQERLPVEGEGKENTKYPQEEQS